LIFNPNRLLALLGDDLVRDLIAGGLGDDLLADQLVFALAGTTLDDLLGGGIADSRQGLLLVFAGSVDVY